jgi:hypothetical protein
VEWFVGSRQPLYVIVTDVDVKSATLETFLNLSIDTANNLPRWQASHVLVIGFAGVMRMCLSPVGKAA